MKKSDPNVFAFRTAFVITALCGLILYFFFTFIQCESVGWTILAVCAVLFFASVLIIRFYFDREYFQKIKLIYKNILQLQKHRSEIPPKPGEETEYLVEINRIIIENAKEQKEEIDHLKQLELYRKEFLGNVSHELKTPIFNVQGYIHTLIDGGIEDHDINMLYLNKAAKSLDRLISIVDDLESISKIESGNLILEIRTFDLCELAKEVIESSELQAREKHIHLYIKDTSDKPHYVLADKDRIRQVLVNLVVNSIKYGKENGFTEIRLYDFDETIQLEIEDNGIGIEKHHLPRLFERFYRVDKSRSRMQGGTGLGLAIVKHIIEAHGQKLSVASEYGYGTTFSFSLKKSK